ncbi:MAG: DUF99 family protein [Candidatus Bathyarchaeia archaeon]
MSNAKTFRVIKHEIRVLGIDDGKFTPKTVGQALVVGVVFRGGLSVEGVMHTTVAIDGLDATQKIAQMMLASPHCRQVRLVMLSGITFAGFNLVNIKKLSAEVGLPVLALTREKPDLDAIYQALRHLPQAEERWRIVEAAGVIHEVTNHGVKLYVGLAGISLAEALEVLELTSVRGGYPEPLRVAHLIASGVTE